MRLPVPSALVRFLGGFVIAGCTAQTAFAVDLTNVPLYLNTPVAPIVMLNMSNDHQLFFKAYDDYSDVNGDGVADTTYSHNIDYYGYFDSNKCYGYSGDEFVPRLAATDKYCDDASAQWAGNFLNWATMTRMDAVRKILYGGLRSTDSAEKTVLERTYLPNDAHSFAKHYRGADINRLVGIEVTDLSTAKEGGLTICNTTVSSGYSQNSSAAPLMRVVKGNYSLWAANERWQCRWSEEKSASNGNSATGSNINAYSSNPNKGNAGGLDYYVRVQACASTTLIGDERCKAYGATLKPVGLLQIYGDADLIRFGLLTGTYGKNKSGGVLRKNASAFMEEVAADGTFVDAPAGGGIVSVLNKLRVFGYSHGDGTYTQASGGGDDCTFQLTSFNNGKCSNWGNPQAEIYLESLRYLAGLNATSAYSADDSNRIAGLGKADWVSPLSSSNACAPLNIIQFNASTTSYDGDELSGASGLTGLDVASATNAIGVGEGIPGNNYFVGQTASLHDQLCTAKTVGSLSEVLGTCPDAPRLEGSYKIAGLAHYAHTNDLRPSLAGTQSVKTYGVALSPAVPKVEIPVPGSDKKITLLPACRNTKNTVAGNCAIVDFKIISQDHGATESSGSLYVNWEDSEQGGDFDQDMWGLISYQVTGLQAKITTKTVAESTTGVMGFGYVLSGTDKDGFHAHSGIEGFSYTDPTGAAGCTNCQVGNAATTNTYTIGAADTKLLEQPLFYAAKWGGFKDINNDKLPSGLDEWDANNDGLPDSYFYATNPAQLEKSLSEAFEEVAKDASSSSSVATNSTRLDTETLIYQARFNPADWSGQLVAYTVASGGGIGTVRWDTNTAGKVTGGAGRPVFTWNGSSGISLSGPLGDAWAALPEAQKDLLKAEGDTDLGLARLGWLRGEQSNEQPSGSLRQRKYLLGDVVNSDPVYVGAQDYGYDRLPVGTPGADSYQVFLTDKASKAPLLLVGANDGMLHGFNAKTGVELFAYMPSQALRKAVEITKPGYGAGDNGHKYIVDGPIFTGDAYINGRWRTIAVGSYGAGGRGIFGLDVTGAGGSSGFTASDVLFELDGASWSDIGYVMSPGVIGRMPDGTWAAVFGNGYNSVDGNGASSQAKLLIVNLENPSDKLAIATDGSLGNGMAGPAILANAQRTLFRAYSGDLAGNLWRFDFTKNGANASDRNDWKVAFGNVNKPTPFFKARNAAGQPQPITAVPELGYNPDNSVLSVFFGTGSYFTSSDGVIQTSPRVESFYGIADTGSVINQTTSDARTSLQQQTIDAELTKNGANLRRVSTTVVDYARYSGWYMDLLSPSVAGSSAKGERVVSPAALRHGRIIFPTIIPSQSPCSAGGTSWLMELDAWNGGRLGYPVFDINGDGQVNDLDRIDGDSMSGKESSQGIIKTPAIISAGDTEFKYASGTAGGIDVTVEKGGANEGRLSWRQLR